MSNSGKDGVIRPDIGDGDELALYSGEPIESGGDYEGWAFADLAWRGRHLSQVEFSTSIFRKAMLAGSRLRDVAFRDVSITGSDVSNANWAGVRACRVVILSSRLTGLAACEDRFEHLFVKDCPADYAVFNLSKFERCWFENCNLSDASFETATCKHVVFRNCNLTNARFYRARLEDVDLRGSQLSGLGISLEDLRGVTIDVQQAPDIAVLTGVKIADR